METIVEKRGVGRPRKVQGQEESNGNGFDAGKAKALVETAQYIPYTGKADLPPCTLDDEGRVIKKGEPRYFMRSTLSGVVELIRVYKNGKGIGRNLVRVLKPRRRDRNDKKIIEELRKSGIPLD